MNIHDTSKDFAYRIDYGNLESNLQFIKKTSVLTHKERILEIGSGVGSLLNHFYRTGYDISGVEINNANISRSKDIYGHLPILQVTNELLPFNDNSFEVVMSFDVFEHIPDTDTHLTEVYRILNANGCYLLQTPNKYMNSIFETIRWRSFTDWKRVHCSLHSHREIVIRFKNSGFDVEFYDIPIVNKYFRTKVKKYLGSFGLFLIKIINPDRFPLAFRTNFYIKATKIVDRS